MVNKNLVSSNTYYQATGCWNIQPPKSVADGMRIKEGTPVLCSTLLKIPIPKCDFFMSQRIAISIWSRLSDTQLSTYLLPSIPNAYLCSSGSHPVEVFLFLTELYTVTPSLRYLNSNRFCAGEISVYDLGDYKQKTNRQILQQLYGSTIINW